MVVTGTHPPIGCERRPARAGAAVVVHGKEQAARAPTEEIRLAIRRAALTTFREHGFQAATLEEVGAGVGITRGGVLHHYRSKTELLAAVVDPYLRRLDRLLDTAHLDDPPTTGQRRRLVTELATLFISTAVCCNYSPPT
jgi:AcrR family transcriptional regulator